jgi:hypothetical protein
MRKIFLLLSVVFIVFACGRGGTPKAVAENFLKAWMKGDFDEAKKYGTDDSKKLLDMMNNFKTIVEDSAMEKNTSFEILREKIEGDNATVYYKEEGSQAESHLPLIKLNGEWKVNVTKESINGTEGDGTIDIGATNTDTTAVDSIEPQ